MSSERGTHLITSLPTSVNELTISTAFFKTTGLDDGFLSLPPETWSEIPSYKTAVELIKNLPCVNDAAERGIALIEKFNSCSKNEDNIQNLLQIVEKHRHDFPTCNQNDLHNI